MSQTGRGGHRTGYESHWAEYESHWAGYKSHWAGKDHKEFDNNYHKIILENSVSENIIKMGR
jgi:hypothetical protein